ncbi:MAG: 3'-5' exonuclease, partial [Candidatus Hydrothermarchaeales archaeon]
MKKGLLLDIDYDTRDGKAVVKLLLKLPEGFLIAEDDSFLPYFYAAPRGDVEESVKEIRGMDGGVLNVAPQDKMIFGEPTKMLKISLRHPQEVPRFRERIKGEGFAIYEHDILFVRRYLIDKGLTPLDWVEVDGDEGADGFRVKEIRASHGPPPSLSVLAFDIEVYNPKGAPREEKDPIIMISLASNTGLKKLLTWK